MPLLERVARFREGDRRKIFAISGPPGAGKSTLAEALEASPLGQGCAAAGPPLDGFHYDDGLLEARGGLRDRKGAPESFDVPGFRDILTRQRRNEEPEIPVPMFNRALEILRNVARAVPQQVELPIVEGNYRLLDKPGWRDLAALFDLTVADDDSVEELRRRWRDLDVPEVEVLPRVEENGSPNGQTVLNRSHPTEFVFRQDAIHTETPNPERP